ncbi:MAG: hypothetical protein ACTSQJ_17500 [Promethearchaeota archaeon]
MSSNLNIKLNNSKKILYGLLERIIFNEKDFSTLKEIINEVIIGKKEPKKLKKAIIHSRIKILKELLEIFPFYIEQMNKKNSVENFTFNNEKSKIMKELREKNDLLINISQRIERIYNSLDKKIKGEL